jgi:hypothetical protein
MWAGCIPVLVISYTHFPYSDIIDYSKFAVFVAENELDKIEETLLAIPDH